MEIHGYLADDLFMEACYAFQNDNPDVLSPRGMMVKEFRNVSLILHDPTCAVIRNKRRNISVKYLKAEWFWYVMADQTKEGADYIAGYAPFWNTIRNEDGSLNSNYGHYVFKPMKELIPGEFPTMEMSQFDWVVNQLKNDADTRQAIININNPAHKKTPTKDFPCTASMQFFIREGKLESTVTMRSTDFILGFCNDIFQFSMFMQTVYHELTGVYPDLELGKLTLFTASLHVYERHWDMVDDVASSDTGMEIDFDTPVFTWEIFGKDAKTLEDFRKLAQEEL